MRHGAAVVVRAASVLVVVAVMALPAVPAAAYPQKKCGAANAGERYIDSINLLWICKKEPVSGLYYWEKQPSSPIVITYSGPYLKAGLSWAVSTDSSGRLQAGSMAHAFNVMNEPWTGADGVIARTLVQRWNGSAWTSCRDTGYIASPPGHPTQYASFNWGSPPCGGGYYRNYGSAFIAIDGRWWGGSAISAYVYAVSPAVDGTDDPPPPPPPDDA
jgi:hypothetical protein